MEYLAECLPDTLLMRILTKRKIMHVGGKARLIKKMLRTEKEKCIGIIDEDPRSIQPPQLRNFSQIRVLEEVRLKLYADTKGNKLIILSPRFEEWVLAAVKESGLKLSSYNLPGDPDRLHETVNLDLRKLQRLLADLKDRSRMLKELSRLLRD